MTETSAPELAFCAARIGLAGELLHPQLQIALQNGSPVTATEAVGELRAFRKPARITGDVENSVLRIHLSAIDSDSDTLKRFTIRRHNLGDQAPLLDPDNPDSTPLLVVAFDHLLRV